MLLYEKNQELGLDFDTASTKRYFHCQCDYCGQEFTRTKRSILSGYKVIKKDACSNCTQEKIKESNLLKYGSPTTGNLPSSIEKAKATNLAKFGVEHAGQAKSVKDKIKKTIKEKYGSETYWTSQHWQEKHAKAAQEKFGVDNFSQAPEIKEKVKQTSVSKYGKESYSQTQECKKRRKNTCLNKFNETTYTKTDECKQKTRETIRTKYGVNGTLSVPEFAEKYRETNLKLYGEEYYSRTKEFKQKYRKECIEKYGVPNALLKNQPKGGERFVQKWLEELGFKFSKNHSILDGKEIDLFNENFSLGIEYLGNYWHCEGSISPKDRSYHYDKYKKCKDKNIRLITIFEDEWCYKEQLCKNIIKAAMGSFDKRVYARNCVVKEISKKICKDFCDLHHIQGGTNRHKVAFGIFDNNDLLGVMSLGHHPRKNQLVLDRMCFKFGVQIVGAASRLFKYCKIWASENDYPNLVTWSDNRWSSGKVYEKLGFKLDAELPPDYSYVNLKNCKQRLSKQSQKKSNVNCPSDKTEYEWAVERGLYRIWDCGKKRWIYHL
ncbi:MAG: hypothetical protein DWQ19_11730 [Crenarchaeota archaeon]|nr:MAG: hypothetical protein DWQ19_11730 [Thermoproteota archaeon]